MAASGILPYRQYKEDFTMRRTILALLLVCLCLLTACSSAPQETTAPTASETTVPTETEPAETISPVAEEKEVIVYFANWLDFASHWPE